MVKTIRFTPVAVMNSIPQTIHPLSIFGLQKERQEVHTGICSIVLYQEDFRKERLMNSVHLHRKLKQELQCIAPRMGQPQMTNLALWSQALALSPDCHLANLALEMPVAGERENLIQRARRSLAGHQFVWRREYVPFVRHLLAHWTGEEVVLVMDRTDLERKHSILMLGAAYRKRLLPLTWRVLPFGGTGVDVQQALLREVKPYLPAGVQTHFYADCEFRGVEVQRLCQNLGWHWQVGLKSDTYIQLSGQEWVQARDLPLGPGERRYWQQVCITHRHAFGPVNLIGDWSPNQTAPHFWVTESPANRHAWRRGRKRYWIEPTFRDWKSYGFDLEESKIDDCDRLNMLIFHLSVATLWMIYIGDWLIRHRHDHLLTRNHPQDYSVFRLGRDYVHRCQVMNWSVPVGFTVTHS